MINCQNCGVELEENANFCSLCGEPLLDEHRTELEHSTLVKKEKKRRNDFQRLTQFQKRKIFWEIAGLILLSSILITTTIDLAANHSITWSKYVITVGLVLFVNSTLISFLYRRLFLLFFLSFITSAAFILLLDIFTGKTMWVIKFGIPLLLAAYVIILTFILVERRTKQKGLNLIAYSIIASGLLCVCIDGIISIFAKNYLNVGWSLIVMLAAIPISSLLLYFHLRLKKVTDLKRFFHI